jgi:hypothetical protein
MNKIDRPRIAQQTMLRIEPKLCLLRQKKSDKRSKTIFESEATCCKMRVISDTASVCLNIELSVLCTVFVEFRFNLYSRIGTCYQILMTADDYLMGILARELVDTSGASPARAVLQWLKPTLENWGNGSLLAIQPSGSFAKGTANASGTDIDVFVSLRADVPCTLKEIYDTLYNALSQAGYSPRRQNVSIGIRIGHFDVDVVPAKRQTYLGDDHSLYQNRADTWTKTNVATHIQLVANSGRTNEIRVLKLWRSQKDLDFPSFYLELATIEALRGYGSHGLSANVVVALKYFQNYLENKRFVDPANTNNIVSDVISQREKQKIANTAAITLKSDWGQFIK